MIKGTYFLRYLKLCLFGFLISCFMVLGNSVSAYSSGDFQFYREMDLVNGIPVSFQFGSITNTFSSSSNLNFYSQVDSTWFSHSFTSRWDQPNNYKVFHSFGFIDGNLYGYSAYVHNTSISSSKQGFFNKVCKTLKNQYFNCVDNYNNLKVNISEFNNLDGYFRKGYVFYNAYNINNWLYVCFENDNNDYCFRLSPTYGDTYTGSLNYSYTDLDQLKTIPYSVPDFAGLGYWEVEQHQMCQPIKDVMFAYGSQYNTGLCYSSNLSGGEFILDVFSGYNDFISSIDLYNSSCHAPLTQQYCLNAFTGQINKFGIVSKVVNSSSVDAKHLWNYCYMSTLPKNATTCTAAGVGMGGVLEPYTNDDYVSMVTNGDFFVVKSRTGGLINSVLGNYDGSTDIIDVILGFYDKIINLFSERSGNTPLLPGYIISFLLVIILFKLFKK